MRFSTVVNVIIASLLLWAVHGSETHASVDQPAMADSLVIGAFSDVELGVPVPDGWRELTFERGDIETPTSYEVIDRNGRRVVKAHSDGGASGLIKEVSIDPAEYPVVSWSWQVESTVEGGNYQNRSGDDYAARVYLIYDLPASDLGFRGRMAYRIIRALGYSEVPTRAISYIWGNVAPANEAVPNPYSDWVQMIAVRTGEEETGQWLHEVRHHLNDYVAIWGERPPKIVGVAIMTDADDTGSEVTAYYGDIVFHREHASSRNLPLQQAE